MTNKEKLVVAKLLDMAADVFANHVCNDLPKELQHIFTDEEEKELGLKYNQFNERTETPEETDCPRQDWEWMAYFAFVLEREATNDSSSKNIRQ